MHRADLNMAARLGSRDARQRAAVCIGGWPGTRSRASRRGFTLVEALAAGTILALSAAVLGSAMAQVHRSMDAAGGQQRAAELLDRVLTKVDTLGPERVLREGPTEGRFEPPHDAFTWQVQIRPRTVGHLYEVTVQVRWPLGPGQRLAECQTLLNDQPNSRNPSMTWESL